MLGPAVLAFTLLALAVPDNARAGGPRLIVGAAEDVVKQNTLVAAKAKMTLVRLAGFDAVRISVIWSPGEIRPSAVELTQLQNVAAAARLSGIRVVVSVHPFGSRTAPLTPETRSEFAGFAAWLARAFPKTFTTIVVGNEPNINRFWMPQFNPDGTNAAAPAYLQLLAETYDALKAVSPAITVVGGALSPRGIDRPGTGRDTHSPTKFIRDLGAAYRASGRRRPIMDQFAIHPYGDSSSQSPKRSAHPNTTTIGLADYSKLVRLLGEAFDGTAQRGSTLPVLYTEYGVESTIPAFKAELYTGTEPATTRPVDEATQGAYYREALELAFCQPTVSGIFLFHVADEPALSGWQSGVLYADGRAKASLAPLRAARDELRRGVLTSCPGLELTPRAALRRVAAPAGRLAFELRCDIDCAYALTLRRVPRFQPLKRARGVVKGRAPAKVTVRFTPERDGRFWASVVATAPANPGRPATARTRIFQLHAPGCEAKPPSASCADSPSEPSSS